MMDIVCAFASQGCVSLRVSVGMLRSANYVSASRFSLAPHVVQFGTYSVIKVSRCVRRAFLSDSVKLRTMQRYSGRYVRLFFAGNIYK